EARTPYHGEYRLRAADGVYRWVAARAAPVLEADGTVREWIGTHSDIDAARRATDERSRLFESERAARRSAERAMARLRGAWGIADAASAESSLDDMLRTLSDRLRVALQADEATVLLLSDAEAGLTVRCSVGLERPAEPGLRVALGERSEE